jgi:hypothetical protein
MAPMAPTGMATTNPANTAFRKKTSSAKNTLPRISRHRRRSSQAGIIAGMAKGRQTPDETVATLTIEAGAVNGGRAPPRRRFFDRATSHTNDHWKPRLSWCI